MPEIVLEATPVNAQDDMNSTMEVRSQWEELELDQKSTELDEIITK